MMRERARPCHRDPSLGVHSSLSGAPATQHGPPELGRRPYLVPRRFEPASRMPLRGRDHRVVERLERGESEKFVLTKNGQMRAVVLSLESFAGLRRALGERGLA